MAEPTPDTSSLEPTSNGDGRPTVAVVITSRDRSQLLRQAIDSVLNQEPGNFDIELTVIDDGSTDDTPDVLAEYPTVQVVRTTGLGIVGARNTGLRHSRGDFVQILDDDDVLTPDSIVRRMEVFEQHPEYGAVHGTAQMTDMDLEPMFDPVPNGPKDSGWILEDLLSYWPQIGTVLTRREVFSEIGGFVAYYEGDDEWDVFLRTARRWPIGRIPDPAMLFRQRVGVAEEEQHWRRTRGEIEIFRNNTSHLSLRRRARLRPVLWRTRGWQSALFVRYAVMNARAGRWRRAAKSVLYAMRWSPVHTPLNLVRMAGLRE